MIILLAWNPPRINNIFNDFELPPTKLWCKNIVIVAHKQTTFFKNDQYKSISGDLIPSSLTKLFHFSKYEPNESIRKTFTTLSFLFPRNVKNSNLFDNLYLHVLNNCDIN